MSQIESINDAYIEAVRALGGAKKVGELLWPTRGVEGGQRHLLACLNPDRHERLSPEDGLMIEKLARERGCHVVAQYRNSVLSYAEPVPIEPKDAADELRRQVIEMGKQLQTALGLIAEFDRMAKPGEHGPQSSALRAVRG